MIWTATDGVTAARQGWQIVADEFCDGYKIERCESNQLREGVQKQAQVFPSTTAAVFVVYNGGSPLHRKARQWLAEHSPKVHEAYLKHQIDLDYKVEPLGNGYMVRPAKGLGTCGWISGIPWTIQTFPTRLQAERWVEERQGRSS